MKETVQVHQLDAKSRVAVYYEEDYERIVDSLQNAGVSGIQTIKHGRFMSPIGTSDSIADVVSRIRYSYQWRYDCDAKVEEVLTRYLKQAGIPFIQKTLQGYSPSEWHDVVIYAVDKGMTLEALEAEVEFIDALYKGDVFRLVVEELVTYTADNGNTIQRWEEVEGVDYREAVGYDCITLAVQDITADYDSTRVAL